MAFVTYHGPRPELATSFPRPWTWDLGGNVGIRSGRDSVILPAGHRVRVSAEQAAFFTALRQREGPWITVRFERGEWAALRVRTPWLYYLCGYRLVLGQLSRDVRAHQGIVSRLAAGFSPRTRRRAERVARQALRRQPGREKYRRKAILSQFFGLVVSCCERGSVERRLNSVLWVLRVLPESAVEDLRQIGMLNLSVADESHTHAARLVADWRPSI